MKARNLLLTLMAALGIAGAVPAAAQAAAPTVTISNVTIGTSGLVVVFDISRSDGWAWADRSPNCTYQAEILDVLGNPETVQDEDYIFGRTTETYISAPDGVSQVNSITADCQLSHTVAYRVRVKKTAWVNKLGAGWVSRSWNPYALGGSCNWGRLDSHLLSTCLFAKASVSYTLRLPKGARFLGITHKVKPGISQCHNKAWTITHGRVKYHATFHHGSASGFSQCWVQYVSLEYRYHKMVTRYRTVKREITSGWVAS